MNPVEGTVRSLPPLLTTSVPQQRPPGQGNGKKEGAQ